jgi:hypothetical protein
VISASPSIVVTEPARSAPATRSAPAVTITGASCCTRAAASPFEVVARRPARRMTM